jgi:hypothetical protein
MLTLNANILLRAPIAIMKTITVILLAFAFSGVSYAQNIFPSTGNVGIGTTSPYYALDANGTIRCSKGLFGAPYSDPRIIVYGGTAVDGLNWAYLSYGTDANLRIIFGKETEGHSMLIGTSSAIDGSGTFFSKMSVTCSGNVGIGTTSPAAPLHVYKVGQPEVRLQSESRQWSILTNVAWGNNGFSIYDITSDTSRLQIDTAGNVGINTTSPNGKLCVADANAVVRLGAYGGDVAGTIYVDIYNDGTKTLFDNYKSGIGYLPLILNGSGGNVGIGTTNPTERLSVKGRIRAQEVVVDNNNWSDYVLADDYKLQSLASVEAQIKTNKHLPGVPSAQEVAEKGVSLGDMQAVLLAKIEELTLHQIQQEKRLNAQSDRIEHLESENAELKSQL